MLWLIKFRDTKSDWLKLALLSPDNFIFLGLFNIYLFLVNSYNVLWFYFMVVKLLKAESEISWRGLPALECLPSAQCLQLERNSGMSLSPRLPARQFSLSLIARAIDWNNCRGDLQLLVGGILRRQGRTKIRCFLIWLSPTWVVAKQLGLSLES